MNVAILGTGGREHALAYMVAKSKQAGQIWVIPGNGGTACYFQNADIAIKAPYAELLAFLRRENIEWVIVGPEQYLCEGIVDVLEAAGISTWGPSADAARLECSKIFAKTIMRQAGVPTGDYAVFEEHTAAETYLNHSRFPLVLKADGLCAGKGVIIANNIQEALHALDIFWVEKRFGAAARQILIEEFLVGPELSMIAMSDGHTVRTFVPAQDHKRLRDNDQGPNTGGMGVYAPVSFVDPTVIAQLEQTVLLPIIAAMRERGTPFKGILYAGLLKDKRKGYQVLEFNVRLGDPECQCILPLFTGDLLHAITTASEGRLSTLPQEAFQSKNTAAVTVVLASEGYPQQYKTGYHITGLDKVKNSLVFHAGTQYNATQQAFYTSGGRVLSLTAYAATLAEARTLVYQDIDRVEFTGKHYRRDIGLKGLVS